MSRKKGNSRWASKIVDKSNAILCIQHWLNRWGWTKHLPFWNHSKRIGKNKTPSGIVSYPNPTQNKPRHFDFPKHMVRFRFPFQHIWSFPSKYSFQAKVVTWQSIPVCETKNPIFRFDVPFKLKVLINCLIWTYTELKYFWEIWSISYAGEKLIFKISGPLGLGC